MSPWRSRGVFVALVLSQSCWLFLAAGLLGAATGGQKSLLAWPSVLLLVLASAVLARLLSGELPGRWMKAIGVAGSLLLLYAVLALQYSATWPLDFRGREGVGGAARLGFACVMALLALWRGARVGTSSNPERTLRLGFQVGLGVLVLAAVVHAAYRVALPVGAVAFPFFASSLAGLALLTLDVDQKPQQTRWGRLLFGVIGGALAAGALASLGVGSVLSGAASHFLRILGLVAYYLSYVVFFVIEMVLRGVFWLIIRIGRLFTDSDALGSFRIPAFFTQRAAAQESQQIGGAWGGVISGVKWGLLALLVLAVLLFLAWLFRKRNAPPGEEESEIRESIRGEVREKDEASLVGALLSHRHREGPELYPVPEGGGPADRLYRIYFSALNLALQRGHARRPQETPVEYAPILATTLPGTPAVKLSHAFAQTRYGGLPPPLDLVQELEQGMEGAPHRVPEAGAADRR